MYLHVKIASLANVQSCVTIGRIYYWQMFGPVYLSALPLGLSPLTEATSMITVSSCGVKLQEVLSGLEKKAKTLDIHVHFCGFSQHSFFSFFLSFFSTWGVTFITQNRAAMMFFRVVPG